MNVDCVDNLRKQKVSSALALFDINVTTTLKDECDEVAKWTWDF